MSALTEAIDALVRASDHLSDALDALGTADDDASLEQWSEVHDIWRVTERSLSRLRYARQVEQQSS